MKLALRDYTSHVMFTVLNATPSSIGLTLDMVTHKRLSANTTTIAHAIEYNKLSDTLNTLRRERI